MRRDSTRSCERLTETVLSCSRRFGATTLRFHLFDVETRSVLRFARTELRTLTSPALAEHS